MTVPARARTAIARHFPPPKTKEGAIWRSSSDALSRVSRFFAFSLHIFADIMSPIGTFQNHHIITHRKGKRKGAYMRMPLLATSASDPPLSPLSRPPFAEICLRFTTCTRKHPSAPLSVPLPSRVTASTRLEPHPKRRDEQEANSNSRAFFACPKHCS